MWPVYSHHAHAVTLTSLSLDFKEDHAFEQLCSFHFVSIHHGHVHSNVSYTYVQCMGPVWLCTPCTDIHIHHRQVNWNITQQGFKLLRGRFPDNPPPPHMHIGTSLCTHCPTMYTCLVVLLWSCDCSCVLSQHANLMCIIVPTGPIGLALSVGGRGVSIRGATVNSAPGGNWYKPKSGTARGEEKGGERIWSPLLYNRLQNYHYNMYV